MTSAYSLIEAEAGGKQRPEQDPSPPPRETHAVPNLEEVKEYGVSVLCFVDFTTDILAAQTLSHSEFNKIHCLGYTAAGLLCTSVSVNVAIIVYMKREFPDLFQAVKKKAPLKVHLFELLGCTNPEILNSLLVMEKENLQPHEQRDVEVAMKVLKKVGIMSQLCEDIPQFTLQAASTAILLAMGEPVSPKVILSMCSTFCMMCFKAVTNMVVIAFGANISNVKLKEEAEVAGLSIKKLPTPLNGFHIAVQFVIAFGNVAFLGWSGPEQLPFNVPGRMIGGCTLAASYALGLVTALALVRHCRDWLWHGLVQLELFTGLVILSTLHPAALLQVDANLIRSGGLWWTSTMIGPLLRCFVMVMLAAWAIWKKSFPVSEGYCIAVMIANGVSIIQIIIFDQEPEEEQTGGHAVPKSLATLEAQDAALRKELELEARRKDEDGLPKRPYRLRDLDKGRLDTWLGSLPLQQAGVVQTMMTAIDNNSVCEAKTCLAKWYSVGLAEQAPVMVEDARTMIEAATAAAAAAPAATAIGWTVVPSMSSARTALAAAALDGYLYALGGFNGRHILSSVERFDPESNSWTAVASTSSVRSSVAAAVLDGYLYVLGGFDGSEYDYASVARFDPASKSWSTVASMSSARNDLAAAALDGYLYALGGKGKTKLLASVERFDPASNSWTAVASMSSARKGLAAAALDGYLYALGGKDDTKDFASVERFDPASNSWTAVASMSSARSDLAAAVLDGCYIYALGGRDGTKDLASVERFHPESNSWTAVASMNSARSDLAAAALDGYLYALGGNDDTTTFSVSERLKSSEPVLRSCREVFGDSVHA